MRLVFHALIPQYITLYKKRGEYFTLPADWLCKTIKEIKRNIQLHAVYTCILVSSIYTRRAHSTPSLIKLADFISSG